MKFRCPNCNALIYSRKNKICGVCEKHLPAEFLFANKQIAFLKKQEEEVEKRAKEFNLPDIGGSDIGGSTF